MKRLSRGFTLIELAIVICILAIVGLTLADVMSKREKGQPEIDTSQRKGLIVRER